MKKNIQLLFSAIIIFGTLSCKQEATKDMSYKDDPFIKEIVAKMSLEDKVAFIGGTNMFYIRGFEEYGIPEVKLTDGPIGVNKCGQSTAYPSTMCLSASWNLELVKSIGAIMGEEAKGKDVDIMLCPGMNIYRSPLNGRNFEYLGEDPYLCGKTASAFIQGMQGVGMVACAKHYVGNNQEFDRNHVSSNMDERTLREIYLPAFKWCVQEGKVATVMDGYNLVNDIHMTQHDYLNNKVLKEEWGFDGFIMSDWNACYDGLACAIGGLDLEMPSGKFMHPDTLIPLIKNGKLDEKIIDDKVSRILGVYKRFGIFNKKDGDFTADLEKASKLSIDEAREGFVLLKNEDNILPLKKDKVKSVAVIGTSAHPAMISGGGSARVDPYESISYYEAIKQLAGDDVEVLLNDNKTNVASEDYYAKSEFYTKDINDPSKEVRGLKAEYFENDSLYGEPYHVKIDPYINFNWLDTVVGDMEKKDFSVRWTGVLRVEKKEKYTFYMNANWGYRLYIDGKLMAKKWKKEKRKNNFDEGNTIVLAPGDHDFVVENFEGWGTTRVKIGYVTESQVAAYRKSIIDLSSKCDAAVVCVGFDNSTEGEGHDRDYGISQEQLDIIDDVYAANKNVIFVLNTGGNADIASWVDKGKALIHSWYAGQEGSIALAEILFGITNPSGKLPISIEKRIEDLASYNSYHDDDGDKKVEYSEGVFIGYRHFDTKNVEPLFPFGFGLSYTTFEYSDIKVSKAEFTSGDKIVVTAKITNTGDVKGAEVVQLYVSDLEASVPRPVKELKSFTKVFLQPGESQEVQFELDESAFAFYNVDKKAWDVEPGEFDILLSSSSKDIRLKQTIKFFQ